MKKAIFYILALYFICSCCSTRTFGSQDKSKIYARDTISATQQKEEEETTIIWWNAGEIGRAHV